MIVGVNKFVPKQEAPLDAREIDNSAVRDQQIARLKQTRSHRDTKAVQAALHDLEKGAEGHANLLELAVKAARLRATVGEISDAMEKVFNRYHADIRSISGIYAGEYKGDADFAALQADIKAYAKEKGGAPRILVAKMGQDGHDRGARVIATALGDLGFDVKIGALFQTPEEVAKDAIESGVQIIGVSTQAAGHKTLVPELIAALKKHKRGDILIVVGGVIPVQDYPFLQSAGVAAIFGPGTNIPEAARKVLTLLRGRAMHKAAE